METQVCGVCAMLSSNFWRVSSPAPGHVHLTWGLQQALVTCPKYFPCTPHLNCHHCFGLILWISDGAPGTPGVTWDSGRRRWWTRRGQPLCSCFNQSGPFRKLFHESAGFPSGISLKKGTWVLPRLEIPGLRRPSPRTGTL